jgi:uncharacterized membrane protein
VKTRFVLLQLAPVVLNGLLVAFTLWQLRWVPESERDLGLRSFAAFYAVGGVVMVTAGITAVSQLVFGDPGPRRLLYLSLVNMWVPTLLLLVLFLAR